MIRVAPGMSDLGGQIIPTTRSLVKLEMTTSGDGGAMRAPLWRVLTRPEGTRMSEDLLRLPEQAYPGRAQADLLAMIEATPDKPGAKASKMAQDGHSRRAGTIRPASLNARLRAP